MKKAKRGRERERGSKRETEIERERVRASGRNEFTCIYCLSASHVNSSVCLCCCTQTYERMDVDVRMCLCLHIIVLKLEMGCLYMHGTYSRYRGTGTHNCIPTCTSIQNTHVRCRLFCRMLIYSLFSLCSVMVSQERGWTNSVVRLVRQKLY